MRARFLFVLSTMFWLGCPGSTPTHDGTSRRDGRADQPKWPDLSNPYPDVRRPDLIKQWPDTRRPDYLQKPDSYVGTPFGCVQDSDCFGQKCCATPWGVKLCADDCLQP